MTRIDLTALRTLAEAERPRVRHGGMDEPSIHLPTATVLRLLDALEGVLRLHCFVPGVPGCNEPGCCSEVYDECSECRDDWPCATVAAITTALGADHE